MNSEFQGWVVYMALWLGIWALAVTIAYAENGGW